MRIFIVHATHWIVPGIRVNVFLTEAEADAEAVSHVNTMLLDSKENADADATNWEQRLIFLQDKHGAQHLDVWVTVVDVPMSDKSVYATALLRSLVSDIESMRNAKLDADGEVFFGPFSVSDCPGANIPFSLSGDNVSVSWPNLAITMQQAKEFLK